jgi:hypothetical protein
MSAEHPSRDLPGRRWLTVVLRTAHLIAVIWLGACLMAEPMAASLRLAHTAVTCSGVAMFAVDLWCHPGHLRERAGAAMIVKLALIAAMAAAPSLALALFWIVVVWSAVISHAPASFRHARIFGR